MTRCEALCFGLLAVKQQHATHSRAKTDGSSIARCIQELPARGLASTIQDSRFGRSTPRLDWRTASLTAIRCCGSRPTIHDSIAAPSALSDCSKQARKSSAFRFNQEGRTWRWSHGSVLHPSDLRDSVQKRKFVKTSLGLARQPNHDL